MRKELSKVMEQVAGDDPNIIFITGDLGFNAFENLQKLLGERFINAGVAEQNMIGIAAGMASKGYKVFCYSIAPFIVYRCLEQMRNDVCFHKLPVFIIGNGGGYGYGIMGSTHHAISDIACLASLPNMKCWVPAFAEDVKPVISNILKENQPAYLRLGAGIIAPKAQSNYSHLNQVVKAKDPQFTIVALGPLVQNALNAIANDELKNNCDIFTIISLPFTQLPDELCSSISKTEKLLIIEEHVEAGGLGQHISLKLLQKNILPKKFKSLTAQYYPGELYGDQKYHQSQSQLDENTITSVLKKWL
ncbi:MAG: transketolase C-terminal domain-containing protein [Bacteroidota bacterium]